MAVAKVRAKRGKKDGLANDIIKKDIETAYGGVITQRRIKGLLP
jgi:hypothetical protein